MRVERIDPVSLSLEQRVERALIVAAQLVELYGEVYLPIFERLERELAQLQRKSSAVDRARRIAQHAPPMLAQTEKLGAGR